MTTQAGAAPVWIVKVLDRAAPRQSGPLPQTSVAIGHGFENDVVLRDAAAKGCRITISLVAGSPAQIHILEGGVVLLGQSLVAPATAFLPAYVPVSLGGIHLAYGELDHQRWQEAWRLAEAVQREGGDADAEPFDVPKRRSELAGALSRTAPYLPFAMAALAIGFAAAASGNLRSVAHASIASNPSAGPKRPDRWAVVSRAEDVFMSLGVPATAVVDGAGVMTVSVPRDANPLVLDAARRRVLRENPSLKRADVVLVQAATDVGRPRQTEDAKRVVAAVIGPSGYLVSADGSKYFPGAQLPTGQVLKAIDANGIAFEEDGVTTQIKFQTTESGNDFH